ncbi:ribonuclease H-like domain-containing protein [Tanacetum coccineum]
MDSKFQSLKEEMHKMHKNYNNLGGDHGSKNDDTPMCERHEANYTRSEDYQNQNSHDSYSHQSRHDLNDFEKSLTELNNDMRNNPEDFKRCIHSMRTVHWKLFARDVPKKKSKPINQEPQSETDFKKLMTKFLDKNGNSFKPAAQTTKNVEGTSTTLIPGPVTADEKYKDAKTLFAAIQTRFSGNDATKKTQKTLLKQMYENFSAPSTESLDSIFNRLQKIVSQLAILGEHISQEDLNLIFLRSLPSEWNTHVVVWRNKPDLDTMSFDDLYNNFIIVEQEVKGTASLSSISTANSQVSPTSTQVSTASTQVSTANLSDATIYAFLANQPNGSQLVHEDLEQIHEDDLEEMDLKWQLALLSMRTKRFLYKTSKKITINGSDTAGYDKSKVECFNCHKLGHFANECRGPRNQDNKNWNKDSSRRTVNVEETSSKAMLAIDGASFDWSYMADDEVPTNMSLMAFLDSKTSKSVSEDTSNEVRESSDAPLVEELVSNDKSQTPRGNQRNWNNQKYQQLGNDFVMYNKACFVCESFDHVQANCNYHQRDRVVFGNNYTRVNYNYCAKRTHPSAHRNMDPRAVLMKSGLKPLNTARPVNIAYPKTTVNSARPISHFSKSAQSTVKSPYQIKTTLTNQNFRQKVNIAKGKFYTAWPKAVNTARPNSAVVNVVRVNHVNAGHPQKENQGYVESGCSRHMTGNMSYLSTFKEFDRGYVTFGGGAKRGRITGKGTLKTGKLNFEDVYFLKELQFKLFSVSQMCDKKNSFLFTDTRCFVLSPDFKLADESQVLLKVPRKNNIYSVDMKNICNTPILTNIAAEADLGVDENIIDEYYYEFVPSMVNPPIQISIENTNPGQMTYLVESLTPNSARSYVMQGASFTQGTISTIPFVSSISPEGFLPPILLLVVIIATIVVTACFRDELDNVVEEEDGGWICFLGGNNSSRTKKYQGSNSSDGGNTGDGVKIAGGEIGSGGGIGGSLAAALYACIYGSL